MGNTIVTSILALVGSLAFVAAAILSIVAYQRVGNAPGIDTNETLQAARGNLLTGMILGWISAGLALFLSIGYIFTSFNIIKNEWLHFTLWALSVVMGILAIIFIGMAMRKIDNFPNADNAHAFVLWSMILLGVGIVIITILGLIRITKQGKPKTEMKAETSSVTTYSGGDPFHKGDLFGAQTIAI